MYAAAVQGSGVGDPFNDISGPSLNVVTQLLAIVSLVSAASFDACAWDAGAPPEAALAVSAALASLEITGDTGNVYMSTADVDNCFYRMRVNKRLDGRRARQCHLTCGVVE